MEQLLLIILVKKGANKVKITTLNLKRRGGGWREGGSGGV